MIMENDYGSGFHRELELYEHQEFELDSSGNSYSIRGTGSDGGTSDIILSIDPSGNTGRIVQNILTPLELKKDGVIDLTAVKIVSPSEGVIECVAKSGPIKIADITMQIVNTGVPSIHLTAIINRKIVAQAILKAYSLATKQPIDDVNDSFTIVSRGSLTPSQEVEGLLSFFKDKLKSVENEYQHYASGESNLVPLNYADQYDDTYEHDQDSVEPDYFLPIFKKKPDTKKEFLDYLINTDDATRRAFILSLQGMLNEWINRSGALEIARIALMKAKGFADIASLPHKSPSQVASNVGLALDAIGSLKDIAIVMSCVELVLRLPSLGVSFFTLYSIAAKGAQAATRIARVVRVIRSVTSTMQLIQAATSPIIRISHARGAKDELDGVQQDVLIEYAKNQEFEFYNEAYDEEFDDLEDDIEEYDFRDELQGEYEYELEHQTDYELNELEDESVTEEFANELYELSMKEFESEYELDMEIDSALDAMENEFMVKRIRRKARTVKRAGAVRPSRRSRNVRNSRRAKTVRNGIRRKRKGVFKKILKAGGKILGGVISKTPVGSLVKAGTSLVRGDVKGALGGLAKAAVGTALGPVGGTIATSVIDAATGDEEIRLRKRRAIRKFARVARDTYREVADNLPEDFDDPVVAHELTKKSIKRAMKNNNVSMPRRKASAAQKRRVIKLEPAERIVVVG